MNSESEAGCPMPSPPLLLIVGASARAAAFSACRAGWHPSTLDLFGDQDLRQVADSCRADSFADMLSWEPRLPVVPWMFTGGVENHLELIRLFSKRRPLWGTAVDGVAAARDPLNVEQTLRHMGVPYLEVRDRRQPPPPNGEWLLKPRHGGGGRGICRWLPSATASPILAEPHYFQKRVVGPSCSASFLALNKNTILLQVARQLFTRVPGGDRSPEPEQNRERDIPGMARATDYPFSGNLAPINVPTGVQRQLALMGARLAEAFSLRGLFGFDFILQRGLPWLVEINPRITSSMELLEPRLTVPLLELHRLALESFENPVRSPELAAILATGISAVTEHRRRPAGVFGKRIVFAAEACTAGLFPGNLPPGSIAAGCRTSITDIPRPGQWIHPGAPICTVSAWGATETACLEKLQRQEDRVRLWLTPVAPGEFRFRHHC
jgi:predicted ATP-grasp superfamily ATP-dependent carboligase